MGKFKDVPTFKQARKEQGLVTEWSLDSLIDKAIVVLDFEPARRTVGLERNEVEGFDIQVAHESSEEEGTVWVGKGALVNALKGMKPPFRTTLRRSGNTIRFS